MKFKCECGKVFLYAAKRTSVPYMIQTEIERKGTSATVPTQIPEFTLEQHVCPYCQSLNFTEFVEPQPAIINVKSVDLENVDAWLKEGYVVESLYAKTATLVKKEVKQP